jgi:hypothetical protein
MRKKYFKVGEKIVYLESMQPVFENGYIADNNDKYKYLITSDENFLNNYISINDIGEKHQLLDGSMIWKYCEISKKQVFAINDKRIKNYSKFYYFVKRNKYLDEQKEIDIFLRRNNSILSIKIRFYLKWFFYVIMYGLLQFVLGDIINYLKLQNKIFYKKKEIEIFMNNNNITKNDEYKILINDLETLENKKFETNRAFLAFVISLIALICMILLK